jgi:hypothetical protein
MVGDRRPRLRRRERVHEREARVVGRRVPVACAAGEGVGGQRRLQREHLGPRQPAVGLHVAEEGERVVEREPGAELPARHTRARVHGPGEGERTHEVRRDAQQGAPLATRLEHEPEVSVLEVADPAVDEPRRARRRAARPVVALHERHPQPAQRRVARHAAPGDPTPDDEHVEPLGGQAGEGGGAHRRHVVG